MTLTMRLPCVYIYIYITPRKFKTSLQGQQALRCVELVHSQWSKPLFVMHSLVLIPSSCNNGQSESSKKVAHANMNPNPDKVRDSRLLDRDMVYLLWYQYNIR